MSVAPNFVYAFMPDGTEVFGVDAFPFRKGTVNAVAFDVNGERRVITETESKFRILDPELDSLLPSASLWAQANSDPVLRRAIKERCRL